MAGRTLARWLWASLLALSLVPTASAQAYRCDVSGRVVFQQAPCPEGRRVDGAGARPSLSPASGVSSAAPAKGAALCEAHARSTTTFADPASVIISSVRYQGAQGVKVHQELIAARSYGLRINVRGPMGGYEGERLYQCLLSEDEARLLSFGPAASAATR